MHAPRTALLTAAAFLAALPGSGWADDYQPGDWVTVITRDAKFWAAGRVTGTAELAGNYTIKRVDGSRLWLHYRQDYLRRAGVVPYSEAEQHFTAAILRDPTADAYEARGAFRAGRGEYGAAVADFDEAIRQKPQSAGFYVRRGLAKLFPGQYEAGRADFDIAIELDPQLVSAYVWRAMAWHILKNYEQAQADYDAAIRIDPMLVTAYVSRGNVRRELGDYRGAVADYNTVRRLDPEGGSGEWKLAWLMATCPDETFRDGQQSVEYAETAQARALEKTPPDTHNSYLFDTLAAAYAEAGDFEKAVAAQERAMENVLEISRAELNDRLELYRSGEPYRETPTSPMP